MKAIYAIAYLEALQGGLNVWPRDTGVMLQPTELWNHWCWELLICELWVLRNECHVIWNISYIDLWMWNQVSYDPRNYESNLCNCVYRSLKKSGLQGGLNVWPRDTGAML